MGKQIYFAADDGYLGVELWVSDGTIAGTRLVKDILPPPGDFIISGSSFARYLAPIGGGKVVFGAQDDSYDYELWVSDGTEEGTSILKDINPGGSSDPRYMTPVGNGSVVFTARDSNTNYELWVTDGTVGGTKLLKDIRANDDPSGWYGSSPNDFEQVGDGLVLFRADDGVHGKELWVTDGTSAGTKLLKDFVPGPEGSSISTGTGYAGADFMGRTGDRMILRAKESSEGDFGIWITDGTTNGTVRIGDGELYGIINPLPDGRAVIETYSGPDYYTDGSEEGTYLTSTLPGIPDVSLEPYLYDAEVGEGLFPGTLQNGSNSRQSLSDGRLLYEADTYEMIQVEGIPEGEFLPQIYEIRMQYGKQLWITDGTRSGSKLVTQINEGDPEPDPDSLPDKVALDLPESDGIIPGSDLSLFKPLEGARAFFLAYDGTDKNYYITDGSSFGTELLIQQVESASQHIPWSDKELIFTARQNGQTGLWLSDGTASGTKLIIPGFGSTSTREKLDGDTWLFQDYMSGSGQVELWTYDGTDAKKVATGVAIHQFEVPTTLGIYEDLTSFGDGRYFTTYQTLEYGRYEPWLLDINAGTFSLIKDINRGTPWNPSANSAEVNYPVAVIPLSEIPIPVSTLFDEKVSLERTATDPFDLDDFFTNPGGGRLMYTVTNAPVAVNVNPETYEVSASDAIEAGTYTVEVTARNNDGGSVTDSFDWTVVDTGRLKIAATGEWGRENAGGPIVSEVGSVLTIGRKDGTEALFRVEPKDAATPVAKIENGKITFEGKVFSTQVSTDKPLMQGKFTVDMASMEVSAFEDEALPNDYRFVADLIDPQFKTVSIETDKLVFQTDLVFDDTAGGSGPSYAALSTKDGPLTLSFGADGLGFGIFGGVERWSPDPIEFDLGGGSTLSIGFSDLGIDYDAATDATYLMGKATVGWGGAIENGFDFLDNDSEQSLVIDLAGTAGQGNYFQRGDKYLKIVQGPSGWDWDIVGEIKYEDKYDGPVPSNGLLVKELAVGFDTVKDAYSGSFKANIPLFFGLDLSAALAFVSNPDLALDKIEIGVDGLDAPIGTTGIFVQGGTLGLENLAAADPKAGWTYKAEITGTFGPDNDVISSPVHGKVSGTIQEVMEGKKTGYKLTGSLEVDLKVGYFVPDIVNRFATPLIKYFGIDAEAVTEFELIKATSTTALDFLTDKVQLDATISLLNGVVNGTAQLLDAPFGSSKEVRQVSGSVSANLTIPDDFPLVGGMSRSGKALVLYSSDGDFSNDLASMWSQFQINLGVTTLESAFGAELKFNGDLRFLGRKDIPKTSSWDLDGSDDLVIMSARWEIGADDVALELILPDGTVLDEAAITARDDMALVEDLNTDRARHVALSNPEAGTWDLRVADTTGLGVVSYEASEMLSSATADIVSLTPDLDVHEAEIVIHLDAGDAETVDVVVFASQETDQVAGIELLRVAMAAGDPDVAEVIDFDDLGPGDWHIYTRTDAEGLVPVAEMHPTPITIEGAADLSTTARQDTHTPSGGQIMTIEVTNEGDRPSEPGTLTIDVPEGMIGGTPVPDLGADPLQDTESELHLPALAPGETYTVRIALPAGSETLSDPIFISAQSSSHDADLTDNRLAQVLLQAANTLASGAVVITGTAEEAQTVTADISGIIEPDVIDAATLAYQWQRDGVDIAGATAATYLIAPEDVFAELTVRVSYTDEEGTAESLTSVAVEPAGIPQLLIGTPNPDTLVGGNGNDTIEGLGSNDTLTGNRADDMIDGGLGIDTAVYSGSPTSYTVGLSAWGVTVTDRRPDGNGTDQLINVERLDFGDVIPALGTDLLNLERFGGPAGLAPEALESFIELYIAYFNRAPDAIGLNFWGSRFADGRTLEQIAEQFALSAETQATYPPGTTTQAFVEAVYDNVLGRPADAAGLAFWIDKLDTGVFTRDVFILRTLAGAKSALKPELGPDFVAQQLADRKYLEDKTDIGAYFAVIRGMSDVEDAINAMNVFDGTEDSITDAVAAIDGFYADALDPNTGDFLMPLIGVLDDPFGGG